MRTNKQCPAGRYCVAGLNAEPEAVDCSVGMYCPEGKLTCTSISILDGLCAWLSLGYGYGVIGYVFIAHFTSN